MSETKQKTLTPPSDKRKNENHINVPGVDRARELQKIKPSNHQD